MIAPEAISLLDIHMLKEPGLERLHAVISTAKSISTFGIRDAQCI
jgi:hypothetical protein